ncbi:hypothetical protein PAP_02625 [Palaeococcus pacificus DY20341]|uniref:Uncharacterized protein n=1 Tax=Palaeococcus pacificus DY20341 TaxID=1343739 RepID=A0A075LWN1_9EURY|nr:hypothetical protein [Palaeococcus pacificus]AIF68953.1 hypothetical protein PAP_02625 [Palaeococcus pacificus DY20341]
MNEKIEKALFEARPYVEYFEELKTKVNELYSKASDDKEFKALIEEEISKAKEPFKTDLRIFLQKFEAF